MLYDVVLASAVQHESAIKIRISFWSLPATPDPTPLFIFLIVSLKHSFLVVFIYLLAGSSLLHTGSSPAALSGLLIIVASLLWSAGCRARGHLQSWCRG